MPRVFDIAYGTDQPNEGQAPHPARPRLRLTLAKGQALRLMDVDHQLLPAPVAADLTSAEAQVVALRQHLLRLCGGFNRFASGLVEGYFTALMAEVARSDAAITARQGALAGLLQPLHALALAPLPLPRAHIPLEGGARHLRVPVAFIDGQGLVLCFSAEEAQLPSLRKDLDGLCAAGARVLRLSRADLAPEGLLQRLGADFAGFSLAPGLPGAMVRAGRLAPPQGI